MKDGLDPARGVIFGVLVGILFWFLLGVGTILLKAWANGAMR